MKHDTENSRVFLSPAEVADFWKAASRDVELLTRTIARCSPRISKAASLKANQVYVPVNPDVEIAVIHIRDGKDTREDGDGQQRYSWCPRPLYDDLLEYIEERNVEPDEEIFPDGTSKYTKAIEETREKLVARTGEPEWKHVSSHDFRIFFATNYIRRLGLEKDLVKSMGGWDSDQAIEPYLDVWLPIDIQNSLLHTDEYEFTDLEAPAVDVKRTFDRFDEPEYERPDVDTALNEFLD